MLETLTKQLDVTQMLANLQLAVHTSNSFYLLLVVMNLLIT